MDSCTAKGYPHPQWPCLDLDQVRKADEELTQWLEYSAQGLRHTLERVWKRVLRFQSSHPEKLILSPKQERLLGLVADHGSLAPAEIRELLGVSKQGAMNLLAPLLDADLVEKRGNAKTGRYFLKRS